MLVGFEARELAGLKNLQIGLRASDMERYVAADLAGKAEVAEQIYPLTPLSVLVGPNASGKSSMLRALETLTSLYHLKKNREKTRLREKLHAEKRRARETGQLCWTTCFYLPEKAKLLVYTLRLSGEEQDWEVDEETFLLYRADLPLQLLCTGKKRSKVRDLFREGSGAAGAEAETDPDTISSAKHHPLSDCRLCVSLERKGRSLHLFSGDRERSFMLDEDRGEALALHLIEDSEQTGELQFCLGEELSAGLRELASELGQVYIDLQEDDREEWSRLREEDLRELALAYSDRRFGESRYENLADKLSQALRRGEHRNETLKRQLDRLSPAEKRALLILHKLQKANGGIFAFESPEQNLYPENVSLLAELLGREVLRKRGLQIVLTSHYPNFLDHFNLREIWTFAGLSAAEEERAAADDVPAGEEEETYSVSSGGEEARFGIDRHPYCLAQNRLLREMKEEGIALSQLWYGQYF